MSGKTYIGVNGKAVLPKKIYVGVDGKAREVKAAYVGVNGIAKQIYPNSILPNGYTQLEYVDIGTGVYLENYVKNDLFPRIILKFSVTSHPSKIVDRDAVEWVYGYSNISNNTLHYGFYTRYDYRTFIARVTARDYSESGSEYEFDKEVYTNGDEGILIDSPYILDFYNGSNINLYNSEGYYSVASHNNLISNAKPSGIYGTSLRDCWLFVKGPDEPNVHAKLFGAEIYSGSALKVNLVPAKRNSDNHYGFYDTINKIFHDTNGDGSGYNIGPEV